MCTRVLYSMFVRLHVFLRLFACSVSRVFTARGGCLCAAAGFLVSVSGMSIVCSVGSVVLNGAVYLVVGGDCVGRQLENGEVPQIQYLRYSTVYLRGRADPERR